MTMIQGSAENWENGQLGLDPAHAVQVSVEEAAEITKATGLNMQAISIRMPRDLIKVLKEIANYHGVGYQPMIRDLLQRWAVGEIRTILDTRLEQTKKEAKKLAENKPLAGDLRKTA